jgi:hypothetical protein
MLAKSRRPATLQSHCTGKSKVRSFAYIAGSCSGMSHRLHASSLSCRTWRSKETVSGPQASPLDGGNSGRSIYHALPRRSGIWLVHGGEKEVQSWASLSFLMSLMSALLVLGRGRRGKLQGVPDLEGGRYRLRRRAVHIRPPNKLRPLVPCCRSYAARL